MSVITSSMKTKLGNKCCNCGATQDIQYHHIVPLAFGGNNIISNIVPICYKCHMLSHGKETKTGNFSEAVKAGLKKAKAEGKQIGRAEGTKVETKKAKATKEIILKYSKTFGGSLTDKECMELAKVHRETYYIYKKQLKEEINENKNKLFLSN